MADVAWSVFTKPWGTLSAEELADLVAEMGFDGIELPVRPGFQIEPASVKHGLPQLVATLASRGLKVLSVAAEPTDDVLASCADSGVDLVRIMVPVSNEGYVRTRDQTLRRLDQLSRLSELHGVRIGIQPHHDFYIADSSELAWLLTECDPAHIGAIWDAAHDALARKRPEHGLELLWDRLFAVNFKNALYREAEGERGPGEGQKWEPYFTDAAEGMADWNSAGRYLAQNSYSGTICLTAEYTDERDVATRVANDLVYIRQILTGEK